MIYITGDTHIPADIGKLSSKRFPEQKNLAKNDYVIICGDFGGVWDESNEERYWIKWLNKKSFTTIFIDGNHENFDLLKSFPTIDFYGATAHKISDSILHINRGEVFEIEDIRFFAFGGASSHDKEYRTEGKNWWKEELPSNEEIQNAIRKLNGVNYSVDYIITHCAANRVQREIANYEENILTDFFEELIDKGNYKKWFFGHYHIDRIIDDRHIAVFEKVIKLD